jgi:hypothetical protein
VGKASTHLEKVQTNTNRYLYPCACGISVKSIIKFSRGVPPTHCGWRGTFDLWDYFWHIGYISHTLPYLCWRAWVHKNAWPGWSQGLFTLNEFLCETA